MNDVNADYYENHARCPECHCINSGWQTLVAPIKYPEFKDMNDYHCKCGWVGPIHDKKPSDKN